MLITNRNVQDLLRAYAQRTEQTAEPSQPTRAGGPKRTEPAASVRADEVVLSQTAQEVQRALSALKETPDVREELVAELRRQIREGTYKVDSEQIAEQLLAEREE